MTTASTAWPAELRTALGADSVLTDPDVTSAYARDRAMLAEAGTPVAGSGPAGGSNAVDGALVIGVVGHAGDGNMPPTICFDPADADQRDRAFAAFDDILALGRSLGGTVTGGHGSGSLELDWLEREVGEVSLDVHRAIKDALDPAGLLNRGKEFRRAPAGDLAAVMGLAGRR